MSNTPLSLPFETVTLAIAGRTWQISAVENQDALLDVADQLAHIPYGFLLWESAIALAHWLTRLGDQLAGLRVLELGAGLGLPGLVARSLGAEVWQTDHEAQALAVAVENAGRNGVSGVQHFIADWRTWTHTAQYDLILGADILYERAMHPYLAPIFQQNLVPGGRLLLTDPSRPQALEFIAGLERQGWHFDIEVEQIVRPIPGQVHKTAMVALLTGARDRLSKRL
jgi:predicted nicotinamide N-methyase